MKANRHAIRTSLLFPALGMLLALCVLPASAQTAGKEDGPRITITGVLVSQGIAPPIPEDENERYPDDRANNYDHIRIRYETYVPRTSVPHYHRLQVNLVGQFLSILLGNPVDRTYEVGSTYDTPTPVGLQYWEMEFYARPKSTILMMGSAWRYLYYHYSVDAYLTKQAIYPQSPIVSVDTLFSADLWRRRISPWWTMYWDDEPIQSP